MSEGDIALIRAARNGARVVNHTSPPATPKFSSGATKPATRVIVIPKTDRVLADLLAKRCSIKPVGDDWHISAPSQDGVQAIVDMLKLRGVHGVMRRAAASR